jgi:DNA sulfur modification protein DndD
MSIEIKEIALHNWLVYRGDVKLQFGSLEVGRNLWIVHGLNGSGKTSLLRAIQWVFRNGRQADRFFDGPSLHNRDAVRTGDLMLSVSARFSHRGRDCVITRIQTAVQRGEKLTVLREDLRLIIDGRDETEAADEKLANILPWDCQQFAFFDGLEIQAYAQRQHSKETREAIELILGIPEVRNLRDDLNKLSYELSKERDDVLADKDVYQKLLAEKETYEIDKSTWEKRIKEQQEKLNALELMVVELRRQAAELEQNEERIKDLQSKEKLASELSETLKNLKDKQQRLTTRAALHLLRPILSMRYHVLEDEDSKAVSVEHRNVENAARRALLEKTIDEARCALCEQEISRAVLSRLEAKFHRIPAAGDGVVEQVLPSSHRRNLMVDLSRILKGLDDETEDPKGVHLLRLEKEQRLEEVEQDIAKLKDMLREHAHADISSVFRTLSAKEVEKADVGHEFDRLQNQLNDTNKKLFQLDKDLTRLLAETEGHAELEKEIEYFHRLQECIDEVVEQFIQERRAAIEAHLNRVFRNVTNKKEEYERVALLEDFSLRVVTKAGNQIEPERLSAGEKEVLAFSFIAGLNLASDNPAPLVMDTPFGHLDVQHRNGLLAALPTLPSQVILLATDRDIPEEERRRFERNIVGEFELDRIQTEERTTIHTI